MKKPTLKRLWPAFALFLILILGISLRINGIDQRDYWYDEAFTAVTIRQEIPKMNEIITSDVHPPMYYWALRGWSSIAGTEAVGLRLFSVLFGVGTIILAFIALRMWFKKTWVPATLGALIFAINPFLANYSQEARMYTFLGFFLLLSAILLWQARATKHWGWQLAYGISASICFLTHYLGFIFIFSMVLYDFWQQYKDHPTIKYAKSHLKWLLWSYSIPLLAGLAWIPSFLKQTGRQNTLGWVPNATISDIGLSLHKFLFGSPVGVPGVPPALGYVVDWLTIPTITFLLTILISGMVVYISTKKKWDPTLSFLGYMAAFPLLLTWSLQAVALQLYVERFLSGSAIFLLLFLVAAIYSMTKHHYWLIIATATYTFLVVMVQPWDHKVSFDQLTRTANSFIGEQEIVFSSPFDFTVGRFYLGEANRNKLKLYNINNPQEDVTSWAIIDQGDQLFELPSIPHIIITPQPNDFEGYHIIERVNQFTVMQPNS